MGVGASKRDSLGGLSGYPSIRVGDSGFQMGKEYSTQHGLRYLGSLPHIETPAPSFQICGLYVCYAWGLPYLPGLSWPTHCATTTAIH